MDDKDKRVKREIANNNERRRMQSINAGFQKLKRLLPVNDGQKLSKAAILQHAAEYIQQIRHENLSLREQNTLLRGKSSISTEDNTPREDRITIKRETRLQNQHHHQPHEHQQQQPQQTHEELAEHLPVTNVVEVININNNNSNNNNNNNNNSNTNNSININNSNNNNDAQSPPACRAPQAAIALPLEVPYTSETAIQSDHRPKESTPKGQNLDTIFKAIMEIEGNRMQFNS